MKHSTFIIAASISFLLGTSNYSIGGQLTCHKLSKLMHDFPDGRLRGFCQPAETSCERLKQLNALKEALTKETSREKEHLTALYHALSPQITAQLSEELDNCELAIYTLFPEKYKETFIGN